MAHTLSELLRSVAVAALHGDASAIVAGLTYDSRNVHAGDCFFAVRGTQCDGHAFIPAAVGGRQNQRDEEDHHEENIQN